MNVVKTTSALLVSIMFANCANTQNSKPADVSLKSTFEKEFLIGTALSENQILEKNEAENKLITTQYNAITAENCMKSMFTHPEKDRYDFNLSEKFVAYGEKNKMFVHGHTLIWHSQLAPWMRSIKDSKEMEQMMTDHITTIVSKFKGRIQSWDVVNEALNEDGTMRKSVFLDTYGSDFLVHAFKTAAKADSKVDLYYNDYNLCEPKKREGAIALIKNLQAKGAKIDGVGEQGHWNLKTPTLEEIEKTITEFSALGIKVAFSELDITVLPNPWDVVGADVAQSTEKADEKMNPYPNGLPEEIQTELANRYEAIFKLFLKHQDKISRVTFWGAHDGQSWLNGWPIAGRTNYPLPFDKKYQPKKAYFSILNYKK